MSRQRRLTALRVARIGGWTAMATAGVAVAMTRYAAPGDVAEAPPAAPVAPVVAEVAATTTAPLPVVPAGGLLVLYLSPTPGLPVETGPPATVPPVTVPAAQTMVTTTVPAPPPVPSSGS